MGQAFACHVNCPYNLALLLTVCWLWQHATSTPSSGPTLARPPAVTATPTVLPKTANPPWAAPNVQLASYLMARATVIVSC